MLADHFDRVLGTNISQSQLDHATASDNTTYALGSAEKLDLPDSSVDLITAAQAAHWFKLDTFYAEARQVGSATSVLALISYGVPYIEHLINTVFQRGYWQDVHAFWPPERRHVEFGYADLPFPFKPIDIDPHHCRREMTVESLIDYIRTWSAYGVACWSDQKESFRQYFQQLRALCFEEEVFTMVWPISVKAGYIHQQR